MTKQSEGQLVEEIEKTAKHTNDLPPTRKCVSRPLISNMEGIKKENTHRQRGNSTYWDSNIELTEYPEDNLEVTPRYTQQLFIGNFYFIPNPYHVLLPLIYRGVCIGTNIPLSRNGVLRKDNIQYRKQLFFFTSIS